MLAGKLAKDSQDPRPMQNTTEPHDGMLCLTPLNRAGPDEHVLAENPRRNPPPHAIAHSALDYPAIHCTSEDNFAE